MNISGPAAVAKPEMLFYAPGDLTVTIIQNDKTVKSFMGLTVFCCGIVEFYLI